METKIQPIVRKIANWRLPVNPSNDIQVLYFGPDIVRGNHRHPRSELYLAIGDLILFWLDENGNTQSMPLNTQEGPFLVEIPPFLPHAVYNQSTTQIATLIEFSDRPQKDVERIKVYIPT